MPHAHFIGLCGAGMSAVARMLLDRGWSVSGSDEGFYPPISDIIARYGIPCATEYCAENIPDDADWIVIGRHARLVPEENLEVAAALSSGKRVVSFPEVLHELTTSTENFVVAGSFGKSTCTALAAWVLHHAGKKPSWFVGAAALNLPENGRIGKGSAFVLEGDEYPAANWDDRSKFLFYNSRHLLLTSGEHDHVNVFPTLEQYLTPFRRLVGQIPAHGVVAACATGAHLERVLPDAAARVVRYGRAAGRWQAGAIVRDGDRSRFPLTRDGQPVVMLSTTLLGAHNVENIVGVGTLLLEAGAVTPEEFADGVAHFTGVRRRLERLTPPGALPVYNDFGSSQAKARAGISTIREHFPQRRLVVCFEPHAFSFRNRDALGWYDTLFAGADRIYLFPPPSHGASTHAQLSQEEIAHQVRRAGYDVISVSTAAELLTRLPTELDPERDIVLFESSGDFGGAIPKVARWAARR